MFNRVRGVLRRSVVALGLIVAAGSAQATWSIIIVDTHTGEIAVGSATCLTGFDLRANTPVLLTGVGAATAQSLVDFTGRNRVFVRDGFYRGDSPDAILDGLSVFDAGHQTKQYGFVDVQGRAATFSGDNASEWKGGLIGRTGPQDRFAYAVQGNILTGAPVVEMAVEAIELSGGSLAEKLMAGMEAAQEFGGDGRCSCDGAATSCGSPPTGFDPLTDKSADIGYMMIARAGDTDRCTSIYRAGANMFSVATADIDADGLSEILAGDRQTNTVHVLNNVTEPGRLATFENGQIIQVGDDPIHVVVADVNADGRDDIVTANFGGESVSVSVAMASGEFAASVEFPIGVRARWVEPVHLNADMHLDLLVGSTADGDIVSLAGDGMGGFTTISTLATGGSPATLQSADVDGDGDQDLIAALINEDQILVARNDGSGVFTPDMPIDVGDKPAFVAIEDIDADGDADAVVSMLAGGVFTVLRQEEGVFVPSEMVTENLPVELTITDINGDGAPDIVSAQQGPGSLVTHLNDGNGQFLPGSAVLLGYNCNTIALGDFDGDGDRDATLNFAAGGGASSIGAVENLGAGVFTDRIGCGAGEYYLNLNVAFQQNDSPDPVIQLRAQYEQWRADLQGVPDAVTTSVPFRDRRVVFAPDASVAFGVQLKDLNGSIVPDDLPVRVEQREGATSLSSATATSLGGGAYEISVQNPSSLGEDVYDVVVETADGDVVLMPPLRVRFESLDVDIDADGKATAKDFTAFLRAFNAQDPAADFDGDGAVTAADANSFVAALLDALRR